MTQHSGPQPQPEGPASTRRPAAAPAPGLDAGAQPADVGPVRQPEAARPRRPDAIIRQQRAAGNQAVQRRLAGRRGGRAQRGADLDGTVAPTVEAIQRRPMDWEPPPAGPETRLPDDYAAKSDPEKVELIRGMLGSKNGSTIDRAWAMLGNELAMARAHQDVFAASLKKTKNLPDHPAFDPLREQFKKDVENTALGYLESNRNLLHGEMERTGTNTDTPGAEQDFAVQDVMKAAGEIERVKKAKEQIQNTIIGYTARRAPGGTREVVETPARFQPDGPQSGLLRYGTEPKWEQVNAEWQKALGAEAALIQLHPSAAFFTAHGGDPTKLKETQDIKVARAEIQKALNDLMAKIEKAVPLVGSDLTFLDFVPIQQQLFIGQRAPSGTNWSRPVEKAVAQEEVSDANLAHLLKSLGLGSLAAAAFIFSELATGGLATFLWAAAGVGIGAAQAGMSWKKAYDLSTANAANVDPSLQLVTSQQVDAAVIGAILDTVFVAIDVWQGAKGVYTAVKGGELALKGTEAGAKAGVRMALRNLGAEGKSAETIARGLQELGPEEVRRLTGKSYEELAELAGKETEAGKRFAVLGAKGAEAVSDEVKALLEKLPNIGAITSKDEAEKVLKAGIDAFGYIGALKKTGGWGVLKKTAAMDTATGKALEAWRVSLVKELQDFVAKESEAMSQLVRTGTPKATSDLDVQVIGGAASELQQKAEGWLAGRLGTDVKGAKKLLDAEVFVDPTRSHLIDVIRGVPDDMKAAISGKMAAYEKSMVFGARLKEAEKAGKDAVEKVLKEARDAGVEPFKDFVKLSSGEQKRLAGQIDTWMVELEKTTDAAKRAELAERIAKTQAMINASHPDAYVGGGVRVWVTGREGSADVEEIAKALGMSADELRASTAAQRVVSSINEGKWIDAAVQQLKVGGTAEELTKSVSNIGKHGARAAEVLRAPGRTNVGRLEELMQELLKYKKLEVADLKAAVQQGRLPQMKTEIAALLDSLRSETSAAIKALEAEAKAANIPAKEMAEFQSWVRWQGRYAALVDSAKSATAAQLEALRLAMQEALQASIPPPDATPATSSSTSTSAGSTTAPAGAP